MSDIYYESMVAPMDHLVDENRKLKERIEELEAENKRLKEELGRWQPVIQTKSGTITWKRR